MRILYLLMRVGRWSATQTPGFGLGTVITVATVITVGQANSDHWPVLVKFIQQ